jgi:large subunit ribosomal protein L15
MNLEKLQSFIDQKTIKSSDTINMDLLKKLKLVNKNSQKLKILGTGNIKEKINIEADLISKSAVEKLEKAGGKIQLKK